MYFCKSHQASKCSYMYLFFCWFSLWLYIVAEKLKISLFKKKKKAGTWNPFCNLLKTYGTNVCYHGHFSSRSLESLEKMNNIDVLQKVYDVYMINDSLWIVVFLDCLWTELRRVYVAVECCESEADFFQSTLSSVEGSSVRLRVNTCLQGRD